MSGSADRLIEKHITDVRTANPNKRNEPMLKRTGIPVWAIVAYCQRARKGDVSQTAADYELSEEEVHAAIEYHKQHPDLAVWKGEDVNGGSAPLP